MPSQRNRAGESDWTHVNDVEYLPDGRVGVGRRNQDQVVFVDPGAGLEDEWTLGTDDDHRTLYEAHNPDYIPGARGGPAVVVADSENNRLVEYQRVDGEWVRTWHWQDVTVEWPRDADRLPSGRTLVADSHGQRILSVRRNGTIAWTCEFPTGSYDVEMLGTGAGSTGGASAESLSLSSRWPGAFSGGNTSMDATGVGPDVERLVYRVDSLVPPLVLHGLLYTLPAWASPIDATLLLTTALVGVTWVGITGGTRLLARVRAVRGR